MRKFKCTIVINMMSSNNDFAFQYFIKLDACIL